MPTRDTEPVGYGPGVLHELRDAGQGVGAQARPLQQAHPFAGRLLTKVFLALPEFP
jgi:hypothetical protein